MVNIQSPTAEIRRGKKRKKKEERRKNKPQHENIMVCPRATIIRCAVRRLLSKLHC